MPGHRLYCAKYTARNTLHEIYSAGQSPHRRPRAPPPSNRPSAASKTRTTKQTQSLRTAVKSVFYKGGPDPAHSRVTEVPGRGMASSFRCRGPRRDPRLLPSQQTMNPPYPSPHAAKSRPGPGPKAPKSNYQTNSISPTPIRISTLPSILPRPTLTRRTSLQACRVAIPVDGLYLF